MLALPLQKYTNLTPEVPSQNVTRNAARNEFFTFDCTPSGGNPAVYSYTFLKSSVLVTKVGGPVLTINPVERSSRGVYWREWREVMRGRTHVQQTTLLVWQWSFGTCLWLVSLCAKSVYMHKSMDAAAG